LFSSLLQQNPNILAAYLGRGTAYALVNQIDVAIKDFTSAIQLIQIVQMHGNEEANQKQQEGWIKNLLKTYQKQLN
jgi:hypothetical protein